MNNDIVLSILLSAWTGASLAASAQSEPNLGGRADQMVYGVESLRKEQMLGLRLQVVHGITSLSYREHDPLGRVRLLNTETGRISVTRVGLRWQGQLGTSLSHALFEVSGSSSKGETKYEGFLQQGISLSPYSAYTFNRFGVIAIRAGIPFGRSNFDISSNSLVPYIEYQRKYWRRNLEQYEELFSWAATGIGIKAILPASKMESSPIRRLGLEIDVGLGRSLRPRVSVPELGFNADLGQSTEWSVAAVLEYPVNASMMLSLNYAAQRIKFGASGVLLGVQFPGGLRYSQDWLLGISVAF